MFTNRTLPTTSFGALWNGSVKRTEQEYITFMKEKPVTGILELRKKKKHRAVFCEA